MPSILRIRQIRLDLDDGDMLGVSDITIESGQWVGWLDPRGERASRLLPVLAGFERPSEGSVALDGFDLHDEGQSLSHRMGYLPPGDVVPPALEVERGLTYSAELRLANRPPEAREERVRALIEHFDLAARSERRISMLSPSERRRVHLAAELLVDPDVLWLDRPDRGLEPDGVESFFDPLRTWLDGTRMILSSVASASPFDALDVVYVVDDNGEFARRHAEC